MAVYTDISTEELKSFIAAYDLGDVLSFKGIAEGVENSNYLLHMDKGCFILTLYEKRVDSSDLPFFLDLMQHLYAAGVICPQPVQDRGGAVLKRLKGRWSALFTFMEGCWPRNPDVHQCAEVGTALARLHLAGADFTGRRANALGVKAWSGLFASVRDRANEISPGLSEFIARELTHIERAWPADLPQGVIHADLFPDNVFFLHDTISGLIDFYFACTDFYAYDLAICVNAWCFNSDFSYNAAKAAAMAERYQAIKPLSQAERDFFPLLARGAAMRFLLTRLTDWIHVPAGALVQPKNPLEYLEKMKFHLSAVSYRDYGFV